MLLVLAAIQFTHIIDFMILMPLGPQIMRIFEISPQQFSLLVSVYTFAAGGISILAALFMDKFDRKALLSIAFAGFIVGTFACALAETYWFFLITRGITGAFGGILGALVLSIIGDAIPLERRSSAMGKVMAAFSLASVLGVPAGLYFATVFSWHMPFIALAVLGLLVFIGVQLWIPSMRSHLSEGKRSVHFFDSFIQVRKNKNQQLALLLMICLMLGQFTIIPFISPYMVSNVGFREDQLTYIYLFGGAFTIFTAPLIGKLADKIGRFKVFAVSIVVSLVPIYLITTMGPTPIYLVLIVTVIFFIIMGGRMIPAMTMITSAVSSRQRGSFMSINSAVQQISSGVASFVAGLIVVRSESGLLLHYGWVGGIALLFSLLTLLIASRVRPVTEPQ